MVAKKKVAKVKKVKKINKPKVLKSNELPQEIVFKHQANTKEEADRLPSKRRRP